MRASVNLHLQAKKAFLSAQGATGFKFIMFLVKEEFVENGEDQAGSWSCLEIDKSTGVERAISFDNVKHQ